MEINRDLLKDPYDLIVIGSGPAGLVSSRKYDELTAGKRKILIVESGHRLGVDSDARKLSAVDSIGSQPGVYYEFHNQRVLGGTSSVWGGWCCVLERRSFLNHEWPFAYDELYGHYREAAGLLDVPEEVHTLPEKPFPGNPGIVYRPYYFARNLYLGDLYLDWLEQSAGVDILFNHTVTKIDVKDGVASSVLIRESSGRQEILMEVFGDRIVLAAGGIQNPRLLLLSLSGSERSPVGRYFCEHPHAELVPLVLDEQKLQETIDGKADFHGIALSSEFSRAHGLQSATFSLPNNLEEQKTAPSNANLLGQNRRVIEMMAYVRAEMKPTAENRIDLSDVLVDHLGQPAARVNLRFDSSIVSEINTVCEHLSEELTRSGIGRIGKPLKQTIHHGGGHLIGSTRMGDDPGSSVTDAQGRLHGVRNLYVSGSSLFPAAAAANPTLTVVALSLRLAHHLASGG